MTLAGGVKINGVKVCYMLFANTNACYPSRPQLECLTPSVFRSRPDYPDARAQVKKADIKVSNGILHSIEGVLLPPA